MIRYLAFYVVIFGIFLGISPLANALPKEPQDEMEIVEGNTEFAFDLYARIKDDPDIKEDGGNLFFSPYSISTALAMTWAGARGMTEKQMSEVLHFTLPQARLHKAFGSLEKKMNETCEEGGYELSVANALWGQTDYNLSLIHI